MNAHELTEAIKPHTLLITRASNGGCQLAKQVISLHQMVVSCPSDIIAVALCHEAFKEWLATNETPLIKTEEKSAKSHNWNDVGERCLDCGDKDWFAGTVCEGKQEEAER